MLSFNLLFVPFLAVMVIFLSFQITPAQTAETDVSGIIEVKEIHLSQTPALGLKIMRNAKSPAAIMIKAPKGFAVCALFNLQTMQAHVMSAVMFKDVKSIEQALAAKVVDATSQAKALEIGAGMSI